MATEARLRGVIDVDTRPFEGGVTRAQAAARQFEGNLTSLFRRTPGLRAERALEGFSQALTTGNIPLAIESITSKITGLGLVGGLAIATIGAAIGGLIKGLHAASVEDEKLNKSLERSLKPSAVDDYSASLVTLEKRMEDTAKASDALQQRVSNPTVWQRVLDVFRDIGTLSSVSASTGGLRGVGAGILPALAPVQTRLPSQEFRDQQLGRLLQAQQQQDLRLELEIQKIRQQGVQVEEKIFQARINTLEAEKHGFEKGNRPEAAEERQTQIDRLRQQQEILQLEKERRKEVAEEAQAFKSIFDKSGLTFKELLQVNERTASPNLAFAAHQAQQAQREEALGEQLRARGRVSEAFEHFFEAERIKSGIPELSGKDKLPEFAFRNAIDSASVFKEILEAVKNLKGQAVDFSY